ncbi:hypothetical protein FSOLCH5_011842 [Fusarium solani]
MSTTSSGSASSSSIATSNTFEQHHCFYFAIHYHNRIKFKCLYDCIKLSDDLKLLDVKCLHNIKHGHYFGFDYILFHNDITIDDLNLCYNISVHFNHSLEYVFIECDFNILIHDIRYSVLHIVLDNLIIHIAPNLLQLND